VRLTEPRESTTVHGVEDSSPFSARSRVVFALVAAAFAFASFLGLVVYRVVSGPALSAEETAADLRSYTAGDPGSYECRRLWLDHWDYRCSFRSGGRLTVVDVRVDEGGIVSQTAP
jgi:hypothetical protein